MVEPIPVWPEGYRCAVVLTIDYNDIHGILTQAPEVAGRDKTLSVWRYGTQRGVERLLGLFKELNVTSSWFVPGIVAEENPGHIREIQAGGHEIACAGYHHQNYDNLTLAEQSAEVAKGCAALSALTEPNTVATRSRIQELVGDALKRWEDRIVVDGIAVDPVSDAATGVADGVRVEIAYRLLRTGAPARVGLTLVMEARSAH